MGYTEKDDIELIGHNNPVGKQKKKKKECYKNFFVLHWKEKKRKQY